MKIDKISLVQQAIKVVLIILCRILDRLLCLIMFQLLENKYCTIYLFYPTVHMN